MTTLSPTGLRLLELMLSTQAETTWGNFLLELLNHQIVYQNFTSSYELNEPVIRRQGEWRLCFFPIGLVVLRSPTRYTT
jgi:hypothetical protein